MLAARRNLGAGEGNVKAAPTRNFRRADCIAEQCRPNQLEVYVPSASNDGRARRHVNIYLASWQAKNHGVETYVVEDNGNGRRVGTVSRV